MQTYEILAEEKALLSDLLFENGIILDTPCGKKGICGKCKIKVWGDLSPVCDREKKILSDSEIEASFRLACKTYVCGKCIVEIDGNYHKEENIILNEKIKACAMAVDIGTTVIEACFFSLPDFKLIKTTKIKNEQSQFGADVVSRIEFAKTEEGREKLKKAVQNSIRKIAGDLYDKIEKCVIVGNTTMLYLYNGISPESISKYPFEPETLFGYEKDNAYFPGCFSSFVGADTLCAVLSSEMMDKESPSLLVDIGTNGEIALYSGGKLYCTSTAAGPALEGASISMGMMAIDGAIKKVGTNWEFETVGDAEPKGICASGLLDVVCRMIDSGIIDKSGYLEKPFQIPNTSVFITPEDVRQVQLAKAAICAGIETLLQKCKIDKNDLDAIYIAGALGNNADVDNLKKIRLIPDFENEKIKLIGNAALSGAIMILSDDKARETSQEIVKNAETIELALTDEFSKKYIDNINF